MLSYNNILTSMVPSEIFCVESKVLVPRIVLFHVMKEKSRESLTRWDGFSPLSLYVAMTHV